MRTPVRESGFTPCTAGPGRDWRFFVQAFAGAHGRCGRAGIAAGGVLRRIRAAAGSALVPCPTALAARGQAPMPAARARRASPLSTQAVDKHWDTRAGIGFHALCGAALKRLAVFCPAAVWSARAAAGAASRTRGLAFFALFSQSPRRRLAWLSTQPVDKHWDTRTGIGFHALCGAALKRLAFFCPGRIASARKRIVSASRCRAGRISSSRRRRRIIAARRYPHRLWTSMRTAALESGFTPCATRLRRV
ncbi:hypothetical protein SAMN05421681_102136 [Lysobacter enzymogenes]|nr:hypothetical protein SAMN05421681_102136 [Lysobacter enzymogenes]